MMSLKRSFSRLLKWNSRRAQPQTFRTKPLPAEAWEELNSTQAKIRGISIDTYQRATLLNIGDGGIGTNYLYAPVRKGIGRVITLDGDFVEIKNLTRQRFTPKDEGKNKAIQHAKWLRNEGFFKTEIVALPYRFQEALELGHNFSDVSAIVCGVDNNPTRVAAAKYALEHEIPLIQAAVSRDGNQLYCAVQEPGKACFGCMFPHALNDDSYPCNLPGIIDVLMVVGGFIAFALDSVLCGRHREWNLRAISLDGSLPDSALMIQRKENCALCGNNEPSLKG